MSTASATQKKFKDIQASVMPNLVCVGEIAEIGDAHVSQSEQYIVTPVKIKAEGAGRNMTISLLYRPEWFYRDFDPNTIVDVYGTGVDFVYRKNFRNTKKNPAFLNVILGSDEEYIKFRNETQVEPGTEVDTQEISRILREKALGNRVGYVLRQESEKVTDDDGNTSYVRLERYKLDFMFFPTEAELKRRKNLAEKSNGNTLFAADLPF
jgi:hypothetical protein